MEPVGGTEKEKADEDVVTGAVVAKPNRAAVEEATGAAGVGAAADVRPRFWNTAGADGKEAAAFGGWAAKEPVNRRNMRCHLISSHVRQVWSNFRST